MYTGTHRQRLSRYNRRMNERLYTLCATLSEAELKRDRSAFFQSIHSTLNHILRGNRPWMSRFTGRTHTPRVATGEDLFAQFDALRAARVKLDAEFAAWVETLDAAWLTAPFTYVSRIYNVTRTQPAWVYVTHMFNHQTHHHGQVTTLLSQLGLDPGITDIPMMPELE